MKQTGSRAKAYTLLRYVTVVSIALAVAAGGFSGCRASGVTVARAGTTGFSKTVSATGTVEPCEPLYVYPGASGPIAALAVRDGDRVEAGQLLATLDAATLETEARKAESNYLTQASMGALFSSLFANIDSMFAALNSTMSIVDYYRGTVDTVVKDLSGRLDGLVAQLPEAARAKAEEAAGLAREQYQLLVSQAPSAPRIGGSGYPGLASAADEARSKLAYDQYQEALASCANSEVRAPASGYVFFVSSGGLVPEDLVSSIKSKAGGFTSSLKFLGGGMESMFEDTVLDFVLPELELKTGSLIEKDKPAFMICDFSRVTVKVEVEEADVPLVEAGQRVDVTLEALRGEPLPGVVEHVAMRPSLSLSETPVYEVSVQVEAGAAARYLRLGYTANAEIRVVDEKKAVTLPLEAVLMEPSPHVFVVRDGRARTRKVELGAEDETRVVVAGGLRKGESVVVKGAGKLEDGSEL